MKKLFVLTTILSVLVLFSCKTTQKAGKAENKTAKAESATHFVAVKEIVATSCIRCHKGDGSGYGGAGNINLSTDENIALHAAKIKATVADPVSATNKRMPKGGQLSSEDIQTIVKWAAKGGKVTD